MAKAGSDLIESLERAWCDALCAKDFDRLRTLIHPDFVLIGTRSTGPFEMGRDQWLDAVQRRDVVDIDLTVSDVSMFDQMLVGTVLAKWQLKFLGRIVEDCVVLSDVWIRDDERWRVIRRHSTPSSASGCSNA